MSDRVLITGACGCIGAWATRLSIDDGAEVFTLDYCGSSHRLRQLLTEQELRSLRQIDCDISNTTKVAHLIDELHVDRVIHLAALQVPMSRADPLLASRVNVLGTVGLFEAVRIAGGLTHPIVYASSVAAYAPDDDPSGPPAGAVSTFYGTTKRHNEATAHVYWTDHGLASIGLRPYTVYGVGRDQGITSLPTLAILAAVVGRGFIIPFSGASQLQLARDVARSFVAASLAPADRAAVYNLGGPVARPSDVIAYLGEIVPSSVGAITFEEGPLPFPPHISAQPLPAEVAPDCATPLRDGIAETVAAFRDLSARGLIDVDRLLRV